MRHFHGPGGRDRHHAPADEGFGHKHRKARPFDYGVLRLVLLDMIAEQPRHGYELMKALEERMGGGYSPSPGVIYPTLAWLEDMAYAEAQAEGSRRRYHVTPEGEAFLAGNRDTLAATALPAHRTGHGRPAPEPILQAMGGLKRSLRTRFLHGPVDPAAVERIAAAIRTAAQEVETSMTTDTGRTLTSHAHVTTPKASGYLAQLCKHFAHKIPADHDGDSGAIHFPFGSCSLQAAGETLALTATAPDPETLARVQDVVASHLLRFAFREELAVAWQPA